MGFRMAALYSEVCCVSLQTGTELVAVAQVIEAIVLCGTGTALLTEITWPSHISEAIDLGISIVLIILGLFSLFLGVILYQGSEERNKKKCQLWMHSKAVLFLVGLVGSIVSVSVGKLHFYLFMTACDLLLTLYCLWVVLSFIREIRSDSSDTPFQLHNSGCEL